jgi:hypothetical protein
MNLFQVNGFLLEPEIPDPQSEVGVLVRRRLEKLVPAGGVDGPV